jgi:hypothetical protein
MWFLEKFLPGNQVMDFFNNRNKEKAKERGQNEKTDNKEEDMTLGKKGVFNERLKTVDNGSSIY